MSFTSDLKLELMTLPLKTCCRVAELSALFAVNGQVNITSEGVTLSFSTTSLPLARKVIRSVKMLYKTNVEVISKKQVKLKKKNQYIMTVKQKAHTMINELSLMDEGRGFAATIDDMLLRQSCDRRAYLRGVFLASGSINHPDSSSYHCEMTVPNLSYAEALKTLMNQFDMNAKVLAKKRSYMVYVKESEKIADFLRITGATNALLMYEDERIKRDFVNSITRVMNMEIANQNKTLEAANRQLKHIAVLENFVDTEKLPETVKEAIALRKAYPEASLVELSELSEAYLHKSISKSGLNHRFRNIATMVEEVLDYEA